jgi:outer membrane protein
MLSKTLTVAIIFNFAGLIALFVLHFYDKEKVVFIDSTKVINNYHGMAEARKEYQSKVAVWKANLDTLSFEIQQDIRTFEKESPKLTTREKDLTQQLIQTKKQQLEDYRKAISEKAGHEDAVATKKVIDEINAYIKKYGEDNNYTIVLAATEYGNIAYAKEYLDITQAVIEGLNQQYGVTPNKK